MHCAQSQDSVPLQVRVLLDEKQHNTGALWTFTAFDQSSELSHRYFKIISHNGEQRKKMVSRMKELIITHKHDHFYINGKKIHGTQLMVASDVDHISCAHKTYKGLLWLVKHGTQILLINCLAIEDYVYSVLRTEGWPGWPLEVNKVLAIASRTYVVSMMLNAKKAKRIYHVKNTNEHQTYSGVHSSAIIKRAVQETCGVFLSYDNKPIVAMFDACCGGVIPAHIHGIDFDDAPYLARDYACTHCKRCNIYSWQAAYALDEFERLLQKQVPTLKKFRSLTITHHDKAGLVQEAIVHGSDTAMITGKKLYSLVPAVKSFCFSVKKNQKQIMFKGRGYGHHVGLCQWGAREMVRDGWDYRRILQFYYPNTEFKQLV